MTLDLTGVDLASEEIRTARLLLRPWRDDDEDAVFAACQDPDIQHWISLLPAPYTREDARAYVRDLAPAERRDGRGLSVAVVAGGQVVGSGGLTFAGGRLGPEIGYWIAPGARGHRYAAELTDGLAGWAFARGAARAHLYVDTANPRSQAVARRAGFTEEGVVRAALVERDGTRRDALLFGRLATD